MVDKDLMYNAILHDVTELQKYITDLELRCPVTIGYESLHAKNLLNNIESCSKAMWKESD